MSLLVALALYAAVGALAGLLAGLLGIGGGLIIVAALVWLLPAAGVPAAAVMHVALATSLASIIATAIASMNAHRKRGSVLWPSFVRLAPGLVIGALAGAWLADRLSGQVLRYGVAAFCWLAAWQLLRPVAAAGVAERVPREPWLPAAGGVIGVVSALVGIGGGSLTVPLLIQRGAAPVRAIGTSAACGLPIALASAAGYVAVGRDAVALPAGTVGYVYWPAALAIGAASVWMAPRGAALAHRWSGLTLRRVFAGFLVAIGAGVLASATILR
jgi:uncharacterized membrane protein YfcA